MTYVKYAPSVEGDPERGGIPRREAARDPDTRGVSRHTRCGFHIRHSPPSSIYITLPFRKSHSNARPGAQSLGNSFIIIICCQSMCQSLYCLNNKFWSVWLIQTMSSGGCKSFLKPKSTFIPGLSQNYPSHNWFKPLILVDVFVPWNLYYYYPWSKPQLSKPQLILIMSSGGCNRFPNHDFHPLIQTITGNGEQYECWLDDNSHAYPSHNWPKPRVL